MDYRETAKFVYSAALVSLDYYQKNVNPRATIKEYYLVRQVALLRRKAGLDDKPFIARDKVELWRCQMILEAIREKEVRDAKGI